jgi:VIT1/CCC1 family predicted Fe2+/Mn2+ transporter
MSVLFVVLVTFCVLSLLSGVSLFRRMLREGLEEVAILEDGGSR